MSHVYSGESLADFERRRVARLPADIHKRDAIIATKKRIDSNIPKAWRDGVVELARVQKNDGFDLSDREGAALSRLREFELAHGMASQWNLSDDEICKKAVEISEQVIELTSDIEANGAARSVVHSLDEKHDSVKLICKIIGVDGPVGLTVDGSIKRGQSEFWWRRVLRKKVARLVEHGNIKLGLVTKWRGAYASSDAVARRSSQKARNEAMLKKTLIKNEAGQVYTLHELASLGVSNRDNRRGELMTRIRGCEEYADSVGHVSRFFTLTAPSKFHAYSFDKNGNLRKNKHYAQFDDVLETDSSPRGAQIWLRTMWARARAELHRKKIGLYGFRVAEPHHDATPHWHALFWFKNAEEADTASSIIRDMWLSEYGDENGADKHRVKVVEIDRAKGSAAGYIAKYITKNVGADFDIETEGHSKKSEYTYKRVDAWAATWGIRQFQSVGLPSVCVWRGLRAVDIGQVNQARMNGDYKAWRAYGAVHKRGDIGACFNRFMVAMGGVCLKRGEWSLQLAKRVTVAKNGFGEVHDKKVSVGVLTESGAWLIGKRVAWSRVANDVIDAPVSVPESVEDRAVRARLAAPWTRFNNCTARLTGQLRRELFGELRAYRPLYDSFEINRTG